MILDKASVIAVLLLFDGSNPFKFNSLSDNFNVSNLKQNPKTCLCAREREREREGGGKRKGGKREIENGYWD